MSSLVQNLTPRGRKVKFFRLCMQNLILVHECLTVLSGQGPCTIVQGILSNMARSEFSIFTIFSDAYTYTYVV